MEESAKKRQSLHSCSKSSYWLNQTGTDFASLCGGLALRNKNPISLLLGLYENDDAKISGLEKVSVT